MKIIDLLEPQKELDVIEVNESHKLRDVFHQACESYLLENNMTDPDCENAEFHRGYAACLKDLEILFDNYSAIFDNRRYYQKEKD